MMGTFLCMIFLALFFSRKTFHGEMIETLSLDPVIQKVDIATYRINHRLSSE